MTADKTARGIYRGLVQGRDIVVPGAVNKLYTYFLSRLLSPAAVGAITKVSEVHSQQLLNCSRMMNYLFIRLRRL
jgi:hypothetical protein